MNSVVYISVLILVNIVHTYASCYSKSSYEGNYFNIACPPRQSLVIQDATFGATRYGRRIRCPSSAKQVTSKLCNGYNSCMFRVSSALFGNSCSEFKRYLRVKYMCTPREPTIQCGINEVLAPCRDICPQMCPEVNITAPQVCIKICTGPGCVCKPGCVLDRRSMTCIRQEYCAKLENKNEEFTLCDADKQNMCPPGRKPPVTSTMPPWTCTPGYTCRQGYLRDRFTGLCVLPSNCPIID